MNPAFGAAMDALLGPEAGLLLAHSPLQILSANAVLSNSPTMREMVQRSSLSSDGSVTLSTNLIRSLFTQELDTMHQIIHTNLAVQLEILGTQTDLTSYLTNTPLIAWNVQREEEVKQGQTQRLAGAGASIHLLGQSLVASQPDYAAMVNTAGNAVHAAGEALDVLDVGKNLLTASSTLGLVGVALELTALIVPMGDSPDEIMLEEIAQVQTMIQDLSTNVNYRFDRVDKTLGDVLIQVEHSIGLIGETGQDVAAVRKGLLDVQSNIDELERGLFEAFAASERLALATELNDSLFYEVQHGFPMKGADYGGGSESSENIFYTYAATAAESPTFSPDFDSGDSRLSPSELRAELETTRPLDANLNYVKQYLDDNLGQTTGGAKPLANPLEWFRGASAYAQLAVENPQHFREKPSRVYDIIRRGENLTNFIRSLTFSGTTTNVNWPLRTALLTNYSARLQSFNELVHETEQDYAHLHLNEFPVDTWRNWAANAPRLNTAASLVQGGPNGSLPGMSFPGGAVAIAAGYNHNLALKADGRVVGWPAMPDGRANGAALGSDVVAIAAGVHHSLALKSDGTVVGIGSNASNQRDIPSAENHDIVAVSAGYNHSLALTADGTIVRWGSYTHEQLPPASDRHGFLAIAAGQYVSLGLRTNRTVAGWGTFFENCPAPWNNNRDFVAIAVGRQMDYYPHFLALRANGTVVGWGENEYGQATGRRSGDPGLVQIENAAGVMDTLVDVVAIAAGESFSLALKANGTVVGWGLNHQGQATGAASPKPYTGRGTVLYNGQILSNVVGIAAGGYNAGWETKRYCHSVALKADGTVVAWGYGGDGQTDVPTELTTATQVNYATPGLQQLTGDATKIAAGGDFTLALRNDGTVLAWGVNGLGQCQVPTDLVGVQNIAAGQAHALALKTHNNGSVVAWGWNPHGQTDLPAATLSDVVAVAAGAHHSLALKGDGTVVAWGSDTYGQTNVPPDLNNVVAVAAGGWHCLALTADATIVSWGGNVYGQTNVPAVNNAVAIAAGEHHSLALLDTGEVLAWGWDAYGQTDVPVVAQSGVVAIAAHKNHSLALKADGTVVAWGCDTYGQTNLPAGLSNVVAVAAGERHNVFLTAQPEPSTGGGTEMVLADVPTLVTKKWLRDINSHLIEEMSGDLSGKADELSGAKALIQAVLELGMHYTLERDDVLHGFFYGTEGLPDSDVVTGLFQAETNRLFQTPTARPLMLEELGWARYQAFASRLNDRLLEIQDSGHPEIPRLIGHTLRLLNLLEDAHGSGVASTPAPALEIWREANEPRLILYGEPYAHYSLQYSDDLNAATWSTLTLPSLQFQTNVHSGEVVPAPDSSEPRRFYRAVLPQARISRHLKE